MSRNRFLAAVVGGLGMLALAFVVAMASTSVPGAKEPWLRVALGDASTVATIWTWVVIALAVVGIIILATGRSKGKQRSPRRRRSLLVMLIGLAVFVLVIRYLLPAVGLLAEEPATAAPGTTNPPISSSEGGSPIWWIGLLVGIGSVAVLASLRRTRRATSILEGDRRGAVPPAAGARTDARQGWAAGSDSRSRVLAAYAAFEKSADGAGVPRHPAETARTHLERVGRELSLDRADMAELSTDHGLARFDAGEPAAEVADAAEAAAHRLSRGMR